MDGKTIRARLKTANLCAAPTVLGCDKLADDEVSQLLKNGAGNGAMSESIATANDLIRSAQAGMKALHPNPHTEGLLGLGDAIREMLKQLRA